MIGNSKKNKTNKKNLEKLLTFFNLGNFSIFNTKTETDMAPG